MTVTEPTEKPKKGLTEQQLRFVSFIDQTFWETGKLATDDIVCDRLGLKPEYVKACWKHETVRAALVARGVNLSGTTDGVLLPEQVLAANIMLNLSDRRSKRQKLEEIGVSTVKWNGWMRQAGFQNYMRSRAEEMFKGADIDAYANIIKNVESGDLNAAKFLLEVQGVYNPKVQVQVDVNAVLIRVVEIVSKYVTPEVMQAIADELEQVTPNTRAIEARVISEVTHERLSGLVP